MHSEDTTLILHEMSVNIIPVQGLIPKPISSQWEKNYCSLNTKEENSYVW